MCFPLVVVLGLKNVSLLRFAEALLALSDFQTCYVLVVARVELSPKKYLDLLQL